MWCRVYETRFASVKFSFANAFKDRVAQPAIGRRTFGVRDRAGCDVASHQIGEGAANIDGYDVGHLNSLPS